MMIRKVLNLLVCLLLVAASQGFVFHPLTTTSSKNHKIPQFRRHIQTATPRRSLAALQQASNQNNNNNENSMPLEELKQQLLEYIKVRDEAIRNGQAKESPKTVGGTKGNKILEYVSGAPVKEQEVKPSNVLDYDELTQYGYGSLVKELMKLEGGRNAAYPLVGLPIPALEIEPPKSAPKLVIDRDGSTDPARYQGLKLGQVLNDDDMASALENLRTSKGDSSNNNKKPQLQELSYEQPFADKRNVGPKQTPNWTPEKIDAYVTQQGKAIDWARRAKLGEFVSDPYETLDLTTVDLRIACVVTFALTSLAYGRSTEKALELFSLPSSLPSILEVPALALVVAHVGSAIACGLLFAPPKQRNSALWAFKGLLGGPLAIRQLQSLEARVTVGEQQEQNQMEMK